MNRIARPTWTLLVAAFMTAGSLVGGAGPAAAATLSTTAALAPPTTTATTLAEFGEPFHFLPPLGVESGDPAKFDPSLLDDLIVSICRVEGPDCSTVKTLTSASSLSERLRIGKTNGKDSYYLANWDTSKVKLAPSTFRVTVTIARLQLGSIDVLPDQYGSFGRTWPIKFRIEKNPAIHVRVLHEAGKSASQVANAIRIDFGLCGDDLAQLLANDLDPFPGAEIDLAIAGVCQDAVIPATTKVADPATQDALASFDPDTGQMTFRGTTATLAGLNVADVLVGEPGAAAPNGYLRKITSITRDKKTGVITLETTQALLNEAVLDGILDAAADLKPDDLLATQALAGVALRASPQRQTAVAGFAAFDVGDGFDFHETIDVTLDGATSGGGVSGNGTVHIQGELKFNAGWNVGLGIEDCLSITLACVDRFEAHVGAHMYSNLNVDGTFDGHLEREVVLSTHYFKPIVFFIGPIPVVLVPVVKAIAGIKGDAHVEFSFEAQATGDLNLGAKWTDPDDGGVGWQNVATWPPSLAGNADADAVATMDLRAYAAADAKLLLYGVAGPGIAGHIGLWGHVQFPGTPLWTVYGIAQGDLNFAVDLGGILTLAEYHHPLPEFSIGLASAANQPPTCSGRTDPIVVAPDVAVYLGPRSEGSYEGYFACADPEGGELDAPVGMEGSTAINLSAAKWASGNHDVVVTVTDEAGLTSKPFTLHITVVDTPPILSVTNSGDSVPASVQYFVTASAWDVEGGAQHRGSFVPCSSMAWQVTGGTATKAASNQTCTVSVVFTQTGFQTVKVTATDFGGKTSDQTVTVLVTAAPANAAPVIDMDDFGVYAASGPKVGCYPGVNDCHEACASGFFCMVPMDAILYNGTVGDFHPPLTLSLDASDPNGDPLTVHWFCKVGGYAYPVIDNGDGTFDCVPYSPSISTPILIWATVSDGTTTVRTEVRRLYMLDHLA